MNEVTPEHTNELMLAGLSAKAGNYSLIFDDVSTVVEWDKRQFAARDGGPESKDNSNCSGDLRVSCGSNFNIGEK